MRPSPLKGFLLAFRHVPGAGKARKAVRKVLPWAESTRPVFGSFNQRQTQELVYLENALRETFLARGDERILHIISVVLITDWEFHTLVKELTFADRTGRLTLLSLIAFPWGRAL